LIHICKDRVPARLIKLDDTELLDLVFALYSELLLDFYLHGQSVCIPAGFTVYLEAAHGLIAAYGILHSPGYHVVNARHTIGGRGTLIECKCGLSFLLRDASREDRIAVPKRQNLLL